MSNPLLNAVRTLLDPDRDQWQHLSQLLGIPPVEIQQIPNDRRYCYRPITLKKKQGGERRILIPSQRLKRRQRNLLRQYLNHFHQHTAATAFGPGCSVAEHAGRHLGQTIVLTSDLADFFPSTTSSRVRDWFRDQGWSAEPLNVLTWICCFNGGLPQGAPTSPTLSNLVNVSLDERLTELANWHRTRYSRYCDDLAFSWNTPEEPRGFRREVEDIVRHFGYQIQHQKGWTMQRMQDRPELTGVVINGRRLTVPTRIQRKIRAVSDGSFSSASHSKLMGYRGYAEMLKRFRSRFHYR